MSFKKFLTSLTLGILAFSLVACTSVETKPSDVKASDEDEFVSSAVEETSSSEQVTITKEEYKKIKNDMTYEEVKKIVGGDGEAYYEAGDEDTDTHVVNYMWHGEDEFSTASITCMGKDKKVISKAQGGLK
jgi:hypothetical protein